MAANQVTFKNVRIRVKWEQTTTGEGMAPLVEKKAEDVEVGRLLGWFIQRTAFRGLGRPEKG